MWIGDGCRDWGEQGAVSRRAKIAASVMMLLSVVIVAFSGAHVAVKLGVPAILALTASWLWARPEPLAANLEHKDKQAGR